MATKQSRLKSSPRGLAHVAGMHVPEVHGYQFFESVSDPYPQRTIRIHTFLQIDICIRSISVIYTVVATNEQPV